MPIKVKRQRPVEQQPQETSWFDRLRSLAAGGIRVGSGILSAPGGVIGAAASGAGEGIAEAIEGSLGQHTGKRIAVEAGLGAVPFGKVFKIGKGLESLARGALYSGGGEAARELAMGEELDPKSIGISAGFGGVLGGGLARFLGLGADDAVAAATKARQGEAGDILLHPSGGRGFKDVKGTGQPVQPRGRPLHSIPDKVTEPRFTNREEYEIFKQAQQPAAIATSRIPYRPISNALARGEEQFNQADILDKEFQTAMRARDLRGRELLAEESRLNKEFQDAMRGRDVGFTAEQQLAADRAAKIALAEAKQGKVADTVVRETISTPIPSGKGTVTTTFREAEDEAGGAGDELAELFGVGTSSGRVASKVPAVAAGLQKIAIKAQSGKKLSNEEFQTLMKAHLDAGVPAFEARGLALSGKLPSGPPVAAPVATPQPAVAPPIGNVFKRKPQPAGDPNFPVPAEHYDDLQNALPGVRQTPLGVENTIVAGLGDEVAEAAPIVGASDSAIQRATNWIDELKTAARAESAAAEQAAPSYRVQYRDPQTDALITHPESFGSYEEALTFGQSRNRDWNWVKKVADDALEGTPTQQVAPEVPEEPIAQLARFFKSRIDAAGQANRDIKAAKAAGEAVPEEGRAAAGRALQREAREAGLPTKAALQSPAEELGAPAPDWVTEQLNLVNKGLPAVAGAAEDVPAVAKLADEATTAPSNWVEEELSFLDKLRKPLGSDPEKGATPTELLTSLGLGLGGAAVGAAADPFDNPILGAAAGFAAGAAAPSIPRILQSIGAPPETLNNLEPSLMSIEGIKAKAAEIARQLPVWQRFSYLADQAGLPANAIAGPYGSVLTGAIEAGLSGDPRGWALLRLLKPSNVFREIPSAYEEAKQLIAHGEMGRAEAIGFDTPIQKMLSSPGVAMTTGDVIARRLAQAANFSADEARTMTLTSEPFTSLGRSIAHLGTGDDPGTTKGISRFLSNMTLPFKRTPVNIYEQGALRTPGLGFIMQGAQETSDPIRQQLVQQGIMTPAIAGLNYYAGSNLDPETAKTVRRFTTNLAGRYSLPATVGFAAGQAAERGASPIEQGGLAAINQLPLPTTDSLRDLFNLLSGGDEIPRGLMPRLIRERLQPETVESLESLVRPTPRIRFTRSR